MSGVAILPRPCKAVGQLKRLTGKHATRNMHYPGPAYWDGDSRDNDSCKENPPWTVEASEWD